MFQCRCEIDVAASPEVVFAVLWDVGRYPDFMTDVLDAEVHPTDDPWVQEATQSVSFIRVRQYRVRLTAEPPHRIRWQLVHGENLTVNEGAWELQPRDGGRCHLTYEIRLEVAVPMPDVILKRFAEFNLPTMLRQVQARAETQARRPVRA